MHPRITAAIAALALGWALFAPPQAHATRESASERTPHQIGAANECSGAVPSPPERRRLLSESAPAACERTTDFATGSRAYHGLDAIARVAASSLARWCLAHGTASSNP
jgi:hypothetical protein